MKKSNRNILFILLLVVLVIGVAFFVFYQKNNSNTGSNQNDEQQSKDETKEVTYLDMYKKYFIDELFYDEDINAKKFTGGLYEINNIKNPILVVKYQGNDNNYYIRVLYTSGDEVLASDDYKSTSIHYLYNLDDAKLEYFIKELSYSTRYKSISDIVKGKSDITELREDDFGTNFVFIEEPVELYTVNASSVEADLKKLDDDYKNRDMTTIDDKIKEIEEERLLVDENGIYNSKYRIAFGTYVYNEKENSKITFKSDNSVHEDGWLTGGWDGSYYIQYNKIYTKMSGLQSGNSEFVIIGNNQIKEVNDNTIWNLEK